MLESLILDVSLGHSRHRFFNRVSFCVVSKLNRIKLADDVLSFQMCFRATISWFVWLTTLAKRLPRESLCVL